MLDLGRRARRLTGVASAIAVLACAAGAAPAGAAFDFRAGSVTGIASGTRAGAHDDFTTSFAATVDESGNPTGTIRDLDFDLPRGMIGNPTATPRCSAAQVDEEFANPCPIETAVGSVEYTLRDPVYNVDFGPYTTLLYNIEPTTDQPAAMAFHALAYTVRLDASVRSDGDYGIRARIEKLTEAQPLVATKVTLWGVPADRQGPTPEDPDNPGVPGPTTIGGIPFGGPGTAPRKPFLSNPSVCDGKPLTTTYKAVTWQRTPDVTASASSPATTACDQESFAPTLSVSAVNRRAGQPSEYDVAIDVPQNDDPDGISTPPLKDAVVSMPSGTAISPPSADGLDACSDEQLGLNSRAADACPNASQIGTTRIDTPLLSDPLSGHLYLGKQLSNDPESGQMYRLFLTAEGSGVRIKLRGAIKADAKTGQLTASFLDNPQLPFSRMQLKFKGGDRAPLVNPLECGTKTAAGTLSSWGGQSRPVESSFTVDEGCPSGQFTPAFTAGTMNPFAGGLSPFVMTTTRTDADQDLSKIRLDLPSGLLGALGSVPVCGDAQAAAGTCGADTRLGSTKVAVGTGSNPFSLPGTVSLAGPYKGAPFSLSIAVPAKAGPLDLGLVVVRSPLIIDANKATVSAPVDDLPQIVGGVPMHYRSISVALDRPGFMFNATNCSPKTVVGTLTSANGVAVRPGVRYQAQGCDKLKLAPSLKISYSGKSDLKKGKNPKLTADLGQTFGQAGLKRVRVTLPLTSTLKTENAEALCTPEQAAARACPEASIVGRASATTPALHQSLTGPVYFLAGTRKTASGKVVKTLPKLWLKLRGDGVDLDLRADSATDNKTGRLMATFVDIPDAPIANFKLEIDGGKKGILGAPNDRDPCTSSRRADVQFDGQNGGRQIRALNIAAPDCGVRASMNATGSQVRFAFSGIEAGKVSVSGTGLVSKSSTVKSGDRASVTASLTAATRRQIASGRTVKLRLTATFDPKAKGKTTKITKTVTIKGAKRRR